MKLNNILIKKGITIQKLSEQTGINYHTLQKYSCEVRKPSIKNAKILGKFLKFDWWLLFEDDD